tara:strand:- start:463 stop:1146 length:684 start_codon:yes stop_codon:yes gene_type:complete
MIFCYNVEDNIGKIIRKVEKLSLNSKFDFVFLDDKSNDKTIEILEKKYLKNCKIIKNKTNQGFGLNYKFSINYAKKLNYENLIFLHGDNQYPCHKIQEIEKELTFNSLCYGSRKLNHTSMKSNMPLMRYYANIFLTYLINFIFNNNATEYFSGFRGLKVKDLKYLNLKDFSDHWVIEQEIHFLFIRKKFNISEIKIPTLYDETQISLIAPIAYVASVFKSIIVFYFK